jgi:hypothetical protein
MQRAEPVRPAACQRSDAVHSAATERGAALLLMLLLLCERTRGAGWRWRHAECHVGFHALCGWRHGRRKLRRGGRRHGHGEAIMVLVNVADVFDAAASVGVPVGHRAVWPAGGRQLQHGSRAVRAGPARWPARDRRAVVPMATAAFTRLCRCCGALSEAAPPRRGDVQDDSAGLANEVCMLCASCNVRERAAGTRVARVQMPLLPIDVQIHDNRALPASGA